MTSDSDSPDPASSPRVRWRWAALGLIVATALAYGPVVDNGYIWDDGDYVTGNTTLTSGSGLFRIWLERGAIPQYYPLVHTSYWLEYRLWGLAPLGYHVVNVLLHAGTAVLFWRVLAALGVPGAFWAALLFALHPVHVESVAWITERKNVLSGVLYFASLLAYLRHAGLGSGGARGRGYALSLVCFAAALLSKTVVVSLPAVLLIVTWWKGRPLDRRAIGPLLPFFGIGLAFSLFTMVYEANVVGATGAAWDLSWIERSLIAGRALWFYLGKLVWPHPLAFNYPRWPIDAAVAWQYVYPAAALLLGISLWAFRPRIGRGALAAGLIFAGTLLPALGFFDVYPMRYSFVADHFQYLASAAPIAYAVAVVAGFAERRGGATLRAAGVVGAAIAVVYAGAVWQQTRLYRDAETLWRATLQVNPDSWLSHSHLCSIEEERGRYDAALYHCEQTLRLEPENPETHHMFAMLDVARGEVESGLAHYRRAIELDPTFVHARNGLAATLLEHGNHRAAIVEFRRLLADHPRYAQAHTNLGNALAAAGALDEAALSHRSAIELDPGFAAAHHNLASVLVQQGKLEEAHQHLERAVALQPDFASARSSLRVIEDLMRERAATP